MSHKPPRYPRKPHRSGHARINLNGRDVYLGPWGSPESYERYAVEIGRFKASEPVTPRKSEGTKPRTIFDLVMDYRAFASEHYRLPNGEASREIRDIDQSVKPLLAVFGETAAKDFGPVKLKRLREVMIDGSWLTQEEIAKRPPHQRKWSRKLINQRINRIRRIFKWASSEELIPVEVFNALQTVAGLQRGRSKAHECPQKVPVADAVVKQTLKYIHPTLGVMIQVQRLAGMRPGEVCVMRSCDIDTKGEVVDGVRVWIYRPEHHKTSYLGHDKPILIGPKAQKLLKPFMDRDPQAFLFSPSEVRRRVNGSRPTGNCYSTDAYGSRIELVCKRHKIPHWHPHQLRHAAGTEIGSDFDLDTARAVLGHRDPKVTLIYAQRDLKKAAAVAAKIG